jgi:hypothetical protein
VEVLLDEEGEGGRRWVCGGCKSGSECSIDWAIDSCCPSVAVFWPFTSEPALIFVFSLDVFDLLLLEIPAACCASSLVRFRCKCCSCSFRR